MNLINTRNRYRIEVDWGTSNVVVYELRFYYPGESIPVAPTYQLEKVKYTPDILPAFDLSKFANDYLLTSPWKPTTYSTAADEGYPFVNVEVITKLVNRTKDPDTDENIDIIISSVTNQYGCLYSYEANTVLSTSYLLHPNVPVRVNSNATVPILLAAGTYTITYLSASGATIGTSTLVKSVVEVTNISLSFGSALAKTVRISLGATLLHTITVDNSEVCNVTGRLTFRNSFGGISYIDINGNITTSINTERNKFEFKENIRGRAVDNRESYQTYTINTGWIPEKYNSLIESLFISPLVYIDDARIILDGSSLQMQTRIKEGLINYTFQGTNVLNFADY
jgi:hypothetical protein